MCNTKGKSRMLFYIMTETEQQFAEIIWDNEPLGSGQLVKLASEKLNWKKSTTYTVLRKLCENGIFKNEDAVVRAVISQEEYVRRKGEVYLNKHYNGSLPKFVAAFMDKKKLKRSEIEELAKMIEEYREE